MRTFSTASTCIWSCCNRKYHSGLGYVWRYDLERVVLPPRPTVVPGRKGRRGQPVVARKVGGVEELHYGSQADAARDLVARGMSRSVHAATLSINRCCCGSPYNQTAYGYRWSIAPTISINGL